MDTRTLTRTKPKTPQAGYPLYFTPGELTYIKGRNDPTLAPEFQRLMSDKVVDAILRHHPGMGAEHVTVVHLSAHDNVPWGILVEVRYRVTGKHGYYRHVFHLMMNNGDHSGRLHTQTRRLIAAR
jgi:hypothetical protein